MLDTSAWPTLRLGEALSGGSRTRVWAAQLDGDRVVVRESRRSSASLAWELDLMEHLARHGMVVPAVLPAADGRRSVDGVVVQTWIEGRPPGSDAEWQVVADELQRLHELTVGHRQRPTCASVPELAAARRSVDADLDQMPADVVGRLVEVFAACADAPAAVVHGDPDAGNIRIRPDGRVGFIDWDESRVDLVWHDLSNLGVQVLDDPTHARAAALSHAWEAANGWRAEPAYARRRLAELD